MEFTFAVSLYLTAITRFELFESNDRALFSNLAKSHLVIEAAALSDSFRRVSPALPDAD